MPHTSMDAGIGYSKVKIERDIHLFFLFYIDSIYLSFSQAPLVMHNVINWYSTLNYHRII